MIVVMICCEVPRLCPFLYSLFVPRACVMTSLAFKSKLSHFFLVEIPAKKSGVRSVFFSRVRNLYECECKSPPL